MLQRILSNQPRRFTKTADTSNPNPDPDFVDKANKGSFYYADERKEDGAPVYMAIDGDAHGKFYVELSKKNQIPWLATFVKGTGYVDFSSQRSNK